MSVSASLHVLPRSPTFPNQPNTSLLSAPGLVLLLLNLLVLLILLGVSCSGLALADGNGGSMLLLGGLGGLGDGTTVSRLLGGGDGDASGGLSGGDVRDVGGGGWVGHFGC